MSTPQPGPQSIGIDNVSGGKIIGTGVGGTGNTVAETVTYHGTVINLHGVSGDFAQVLHAIQRISTDIPAGSAPVAPAPAAEANMQARIDELLELMRNAEARGESASEVAAGPVHLSRVDLLVKKAVLLVDEANRVSVQALGPRGAELAAGLDPGALGEMLVGRDSPAATETLREALQVLREAVRVAPDSAGVLLHMAQVFGRLSKHATDDERGILRHALRLLDPPRTEEQRLHHAQAVYLLGTVGDERDAALLVQARAEFAALGRAEWVRRCDEALAATPDGGAARTAGAAPREPMPRASVPRTAGPGARRWVWGGGAAAVVVVLLFAINAARADGDPRPVPGPDGPRPAPLATSATVFHPVGTWLVEIGDAVGSTMVMELARDGTYSGAQRLNGVDYAFQGRWSWDAEGRQLTMDGSVEGVGASRVGYTITGRQDSSWTAREQSGLMARFTRR